MSIDLQGNVAGAVFGLAYGDALGRPTEFMTIAKIHEKYGRHGLLDLPSGALFTDDTQMMIALNSALTRPDITPRHIVQHVTDAFMHWAKNDPPRAPGTSCLTAIAGMHRRRKGKHAWHTATTLSKGCGANMRTLPTALLYSEAMSIGASQLQAALTHGHVEAIVATELTAVAMRRVITGEWAIHDIASACAQYALARSFDARYNYEWLGALEMRWATYDPGYMVRRAWARLHKMLTHVEDVLLMDAATITKDIDDDICTYLGEGWVADEALMCALYFANRYAKNPHLAISEAARTSGDSDSIACIAGALVGGAHGIDSWPARWRFTIERAADLEWVATNCAERM